jgi:DNA-directed RNA polymerase subunit RPC12/RpoP
MRDEASYICDWCGEEVVIPLDPSAGASQEYVEDCPVCCHPNVIHVALDEGDVRAWAEREQ